MRLLVSRHSSNGEQCCVDGEQCCAQSPLSTLCAGLVEHSDHHLPADLKRKAAKSTGKQQRSRVWIVHAPQLKRHWACLPAGLRRKAEELTVQQQQDVHCHKIVLCNKSPGYWRRRILAWLPSTAPAAPTAMPPPPAVKRGKANSSKQGKATGDAETAGSQAAPHSAAPVIEEHCTSEELPACLAVLQHGYTGQLPEGADLELLCRVRS